MSADFKNQTMLCDGPGHEIWKQFLLESPIPEYNIGETMIIADDWDHYENISKHDVIGGQMD